MQRRQCVALHIPPWVCRYVARQQPARGTPPPFPPRQAEKRCVCKPWELAMRQHAHLSCRLIYRPIRSCATLQQYYFHINQTGKRLTETAQNTACPAQKSFLPSDLAKRPSSGYDKYDTFSMISRIYLWFHICQFEFSLSDPDKDPKNLGFGSALI